jgi:hypothetical protein
MDLTVGLGLLAGGLTTVSFVPQVTPTWAFLSYRTVPRPNRATVVFSLTAPSSSCAFCEAASDVKAHLASERVAFTSLFALR